MKTVSSHLKAERNYIALSLLYKMKHMTSYDVIGPAILDSPFYIK